MIAPSTADGAATLRPAKKLGSAARRRTLRSSIIEPPPQARTKAMLVGSAERRPSVVATSMGNSTAREARTTLVDVPPKIAWTIGPIATMGTQYVATPAPI